ncbi:arsenate reductase [Zalerion maritima]|uniref:Arsenate reductase n=1 Tax=Zalerion maritima TaxID=339359 RepID=A0AAD5RIF8_9PEZI|nr:arsenate reductase [Zalerion maritima]
MKLSLLAFATAAVAAAPAAEVFIFDPAVQTQQNTDATPEVSREVACLVFAHRLRDAPDESGPALPETVAADELDTQIDVYGKPRQSLFSPQRAERAPQLVVLVEGATDENMKDVSTRLDGIGMAPAFTVPEPPSAEANHDLVANDLAAFTVDGSRSCTLDVAVNYGDQRCWNGDALIVKYDAQKDTKSIDTLAQWVANFQQWAMTGELETTLVILPESSRVGPVDRWGPHPSKLSRRQKETVMELSTSPSSTPTPVSEADDMDDISNVQFSPNPDAGAVVFSSGACFTSRSACMTDTFGCFRHGSCEEATEDCWKCVCGTTKDKFSVETAWTGELCQKADVTAEFWMFASVGLIVILAVGGALGLLYAAGGQELPGVLGAGVVKTK